MGDEPDDHWHRLAEYPLRSLAEMAMERLRSAGIRAWMDADDAGGAYPALIMDRPVRIFVRYQDHVWARNELGLD